MLVYIERNYEFPDLLRQTPGNSGKWGDLEFACNSVKKCDYVVVLNQPGKDIHTTCLDGGKIMIVQEPPYERNNFLKYHFRFYDTIIAGFGSDENFKIINMPAALPWHIGKSYDELIGLQPGSKKDKVSWITSNNSFYPQHKTRLDFINYLKSKQFDFDLFGRGFHPIEDKFDGIYPYKYTIAAENYIGDDYFTEKISDAFLSWSMPIYSGCRNISRYFPEGSLIKVDLNKPEEALEIIKQAIADKLWDKNIDAIKEAREMVLNKYQLFPMVADLIKNKPLNTNSYSKVFIPRSGLTKLEEIKKNIKSIFGQ